MQENKSGCFFWTQCGTYDNSPVNKGTCLSSKMLNHELQTLSFWCLKLRPLKVLYEFIDKWLIITLWEFTLIIKQAEQAARLQQANVAVISDSTSNYCEWGIGDGSPLCTWIQLLCDIMSGNMEKIIFTLLWSRMKHNPVRFVQKWHRFSYSFSA